MGIDIETFYIRGIAINTTKYNHKEIVNKLKEKFPNIILKEIYQMYGGPYLYLVDIEESIDEYHTSYSSNYNSYIINMEYSPDSSDLSNLRNKKDIISYANRQLIDKEIPSCIKQFLVNESLISPFICNFHHLIVTDYS